MTMLKPLSDQNSWVLVQTTQHGDMDAYAELWRRYHRELTKTISRLLPPSRYEYLQAWDQAREIVDEAFTRGLKSIDTFTRPDYDVAVWFERIAKNIMLDHLKSHRYRYTVTLDPVTLTSIRKLLPHEHTSDAGTDAIRGFIASDVRRTVAQLRPSHREVVILYYFHEMPIAAIAARRGAHPRAVKALLVRARWALRDRLSRDLLDGIAA